jgi:type II secretory pathway pseudopilin PulG
MRTHRSDAGFSLAALIFFLTAISILLAVAVPAYQMQAKREMEEELIFRGEEYMRAIQKYQRRFGVYPTTIDQLVSTNQLRFLRRPYKDPITGEEFRLITINPDGSVGGSKMFMQNMTNQSMFGNNVSTFGAQNQQQGQQRGQQAPQMAQQQLQQMQQSLQQLGQQQRGFQAAGQQQQQGFGVGGGGSNAPGGAGGVQQTQRGQQGQRGAQAGGFGGGLNAAGGSQQFAGSGIIGVASKSEKESIKVYNTRQKYDEWEFIAIFGQQAQGQQQPNPNQQQQNQNQQQNPFAQQSQSPFGPGQNNPFQNSTNPLGGAPTTSAFGPLGGARGQRQTQPQGPFGFGGQPPQPPVQPGR